MRPWKARSKTTTPGLPVAARAILTAFSIASAPEFSRIDFCSPVDLLVDRRDDGRRSVAEVLAGDPAGEVEELAAVDVPDARALGAGDDERGRRDAAGDVALARCEDLVGGAGSFFH